MVWVYIRPRALPEPWYQSIYVIELCQSPSISPYTSSSSVGATVSVYRRHRALPEPWYQSIYVIELCQEPRYQSTYVIELCQSHGIRLCTSSSSARAAVCLHTSSSSVRAAVSVYIRHRALLAIASVYISIYNLVQIYLHYTIPPTDRLCDLVVRLPGCRPRGPGCDSRRCQIFCVAVGLKQGPFSRCEDKWGATWKERSGSDLENWD
jgi:hypothetical protein